MKLALGGQFPILVVSIPLLPLIPAGGSARLSPVQSRRTLIGSQECFALGGYSLRICGLHVEDSEPVILSMTGSFAGLLPFTCLGLSCGALTWP